MSATYFELPTKIDKVIEFNRPFIYAIQDEYSDEILYLGKVETFDV